MKERDQELTTDRKLEEVSRKILTVSRNELYLKMRFLDVALGSLAFVMDAGAKGHISFGRSAAIRKR